MEDLTGTSLSSPSQIDYLFGSATRCRGPSTKGQEPGTTPPGRRGCLHVCACMYVPCEFSCRTTDLSHWQPVVALQTSPSRCGGLSFSLRDLSSHLQFRSNVPPSQNEGGEILWYGTGNSFDPPMRPQARRARIAHHFEGCAPQHTCACVPRMGLLHRRAWLPRALGEHPPRTSNARNERQL